LAIELKVPTVGESITEVFIGDWLTPEGQSVAEGDPIVEIESDKATMELPAPVSGTVTQVLKKSGESALVDEVIGYMEEGEVSAPTAAPTEEKSEAVASTVAAKSDGAQPAVMPAAQRLLAEQGLSASDVRGTGPGGRILKEDVQQIAAGKTGPPQSVEGDRTEETVSMSPMRRSIAARLVEAQQTAALLTTFNEVDMTAAMALRKKHQEAFVEKYGVKLGFMSIFIKASIEALKTVPQVNAIIDGTNVIYRNYYDISVAVASGKGLVVPVIRNAERLSFAEIEVTIGDFAARAKKNKIAMAELEGGTFTISNGGVFGSMLSTPIINPPQSGILGLHTIQQRPVAIDGEVVIRPMMYVALTYDHRIVDGREAVTFLLRIKEVVEDPQRILIEV